MREGLFIADLQVTPIVLEVRSAATRSTSWSIGGVTIAFARNMEDSQQIPWE